MVALQHAVAGDEALDLPGARREVERLLSGLPKAALAARPSDVRRAARRCIEADAAAARRRLKVGEAPSLDEGAAAAALDAYADVAGARRALDVMAAESQRLVAIGNACGLAGLLGAAALIRQGFEPIATPVYVAVASAAAGPITTIALAIARHSAGAIRVNQARAAWVDALAATGSETMGGLHARRIALTAWTRREQEAMAAEATAASRRAEWHRLVGATFAPTEGPVVAVRLEAARTAQLRLLRALLEDRLQPRAARPLRRQPIALGPAPEAVAASPRDDGMVDVNTPVGRPPDQTPSGEYWLGSALSRLRGRGMRLWSR